MDYQKFREDFQRSGLSQKEYGKQHSMSPSMVHYYLQKSKKEQHNAKDFKFSELIVEKQEERHIKIITSSGLEIRIPL